MERSDLLQHVAGVADRMGLRYFVTGSTATIYYGEPRLTNDIDVVADLDESRVVEFCRQFPATEFYVSEPAAIDAVRRRSQFSIIHPVSGLKLDVIVPEKSLFNQSRFSRRRRIRTADDGEAWFASPEDAILKKLEFYREGGSEKHLRDIPGILKTSNSQLDNGYIEHWANDLGLADIWNAVMQRAAES